MLITTITLDAHQLMAEAAERIEGIPDDSYVIVRRRENLDLYWYRFQAGFIREMAERYPEGPVIEVLNLHESGADTTIQLEDLTDQTQHPTGIVLDGANPIGILTDDGAPATRGGIIGEPAEHAHGAGVEIGGDVGIPMGPPPAAADVAAAAEEEEEPVDAAPGVDPNKPEAPSPFSAYPRLDCPDKIGVGASFDLVVALNTGQQPGAVGGQVTVDAAADEFDLVVQVVAEGFSTDRVRDVLHVVRSNLTANEVRFTLTAEQIGQQLSPKILQVDFSYGGVLCGRAYRAIVVAQNPDDAVVPPSSTVAMPLAITSTEEAPDLTITITESDDGTQLEWQFSNDGNVDLPATTVRRRFKGHNAKSFAMQQIRLANQSIGEAAVGNKMLGIARTIADQMPTEAWKALAAVWTKLKSENEIPSVLLVSSDPYIPWELASTESDYIDDTLTDDAVPPFLGAQIRISRWTAPQPRGSAGILSPPLPPPARIDVGTMAVVTGDYLTMSGQRALPKAVEEGNMLAAKYNAVHLTATLEEVDPLFDGTLARDGETVDPELIHFACHGQVDPNPGFNGIILNEGNERLDALYVAGNRIKRPFVFLNACQIGQATELLDDSGGMADEFLKTGASGFVAPLWSVDDQVAQDTAMAFYKSALEEGVPIAEILRRRRAQYDPDHSPQTSHLAYIYYGHPRLEMKWAK